jgi:DNA-binding transcriptional regulator LsrR (DeoR family)
METRWYENCKHFKNKEEIMEQELKDMIEDLYQQGLAPEEIAEELGLDETKVMDYCATIL